LGLQQQHSPPKSIATQPLLPGRIPVKAAEDNMMHSARVLIAYVYVQGKSIYSIILHIRHLAYAAGGSIVEKA
jgi:hypothetical protein